MAAAPQGSFVSKSIKGGTYWYLQRREGDRKRQQYLGRESPSLLAWIDSVREARARLAVDADQRARLCSMLVAGGAATEIAPITRVLSLLAQAGRLPSGRGPRRHAGVQRLWQHARRPLRAAGAANSGHRHRPGPFDRYRPLARDGAARCRAVADRFRSRALPGSRNRSEAAEHLVQGPGPGSAGGLSDAASGPGVRGAGLPAGPRGRRPSTQIPGLPDREPRAGGRRQRQRRPRQCSGPWAVRVPQALDLGTAAGLRADEGPRRTGGRPARCSKSCWRIAPGTSCWPGRRCTAALPW